MREGGEVEVPAFVVYPISPAFGRNAVGAFGIGMSVALPLRSKTCVIVRLGFRVVSELGILRTRCEERTRTERGKKTMAR